MSTIRRLAAGAAAGLAIHGAPAHDLAGLVAERNALDPATKAKFDEVAELRHLLAQRAAKKTDGGALEAVVQRALRWDGSTIKVCFLDGQQAARRHVAQVAGAWSERTGVRFDFGPPANIRTCTSSNPGDIRVSFAGSGYWSYVGTQARSINATKATLNLQGFDKPATSFTEQDHGVILHEFGHALGFEHEHQSPAAGCDKEFDWDYLYSSLGWSKEEVDRNMARFNASSTKTGLVATGFDAESVMLYSLAARAFKDPTSAKCYIPTPNVRPSATDMAAANDLYPAQGTPPLPAAAPRPMAALSDDEMGWVRRLKRMGYSGEQAR